MLRRIYRQRRRLIVGSFFFMLGVMIMLLQKFGLGILEFYSIWIAVATVLLTGLIMMAAYIVVASVFIGLFPDWRTLVEMVALIFFTNTVIEYGLPSLLVIPYFNALMPLILTFTLYSLVYGDLLTRFRLWMDHSTTRSFVSPKSAEELWAELIPGEAPVDAHWDSMLYSLETDEDDPDSYFAQYTHGGSFYEHQTMTFLEKDAPHYAKYHHVGEVDPKNRSLVEGTYAVHITPQNNGGCRVSITGTRTLLLHNTALLIWFDDYLGDQIDHLRAKHLNRSDWSLCGRARRKISKYA